MAQIAQGNSSNSTDVSLSTLQSVATTYKALIFNRFLIDRKISSLVETIKKDGLPINLQTGDIQLSLLPTDTKGKSTDDAKTVKVENSQSLASTLGNLNKG